MEGEGLMGSSPSVYLEGVAAACGVPDEPLRPKLQSCICVLILETQKQPDSHLKIACNRRRYSNKKTTRKWQTTV